MLMSRTPDKLLPLFSSGCTTQALAAMARYIRQGYVILALDMRAIDFARRASFPYVCMDAFLDVEALFRLTVLANHYGQRWYQEHKALFTMEGVCWPELDRDTMYFFWRETVAAAGFMEAFLAGGGRDVAFLSENPRIPALFYYRSTVWRSVVETALEKGPAAVAGVLERAVVAAGGAGPLDDFTVELPLPPTWAAAAIDPAKPGLRPTSPILFAVNGAELNRFVPVIKETAARHAGQVVVYLTEDYKAQAHQWRRELGLPVQPGPPHFAPHPALRERLNSAFATLREQSRDKPWAMFLDIAYHFEHYLGERWPDLMGRLHWWREAIARENPLAVVNSMLLDTESQLPAVAAGDLGLLSYSLPHARMQRIRNHLPARHLLYDFVPLRLMLEKTGIRRDRLLPCKTVISDASYQTPVRVGEDAAAARTLNILVVVSPTFNAGSYDDELIIPRTLPLRQVEHIRALADPPEDLAAAVSVMFKVYPLAPEYEAFTVAGVDIASKVLPLKSDMLDALDQFDLMIDLNCASVSAEILCIRQGKPIVYLWDCYTKWPDTNYEIMLLGGESVPSVAGFWDLVRAVLADPGRLEAIREHGRKFREKYLDTAQAPSLLEIIKRHAREYGIGRTPA
ncbi:MAG: hypothetical protein AB7D37_14825 [Desulfovibrio sp.]